MKYPKKYTQKEWNRFSWDMQERICERYNVFLTDHKTKKEKIFSIIDKVNIKNLNSGIEKFNKGVSQFSKVVASTQPKKKDSGFKIDMSEREYNSLFGPRKSKVKGNTMNFWSEDAPTRKRRNKRAKSVQKKETSFYGEKRMKFF